MGKNEEANQYFKKAIEVDQKCTPAMVHILAILQKDEQFEEMLTRAVEYCSKSP